MSQENVEIVRRAFEASAEGDVSVWFQAADPDIRVHPRSDEPDAADEYRGLDGLMDYLMNWYGNWDDYEVDPIEIIDAGKHVLVVARERGRVESTGVEVEEDFNHSFVLRDGKVVEWHMYNSHAEALAAVGLSE
jgi:ketosteroid isomerase-like protein